MALAILVAGGVAMVVFLPERGSSEEELASNIERFTSAPKERQTPVGNDGLASGGKHTVVAPMESENSLVGADGSKAERAVESEGSLPVPDAPLVTYTGTGTSSDQRVNVVLRPDRFYGVLGPDDITPIYDPVFIPADKASLPDPTHVIGVAINGEARAYPVNVLRFHEMVNDQVAGVPILVTW